MHTKSNSRNAAMLLVALFPLAFSACASLSNTEMGALIGAGGGAAVGAAVGKATGSTARGAIIGAAVGGIAGAVIGHQMDQQAEELAQSIPNATVQRVGEGIVVTFDSGILFDFDSADLRPAARENLRNLARSLQKYDGTDVLLVGHTDAIGSEAYNSELSRRRSQSAADLLLAVGVATTRIRAVGRGESEPIASNDNDYGRQQNRRVEVAIFASEEMQQRALREAAG